MLDMEIQKSVFQIYLIVKTTSWGSRNHTKPLSQGLSFSRSAVRPKTLFLMHAGESFYQID